MGDDYSDGACESWLHATAKRLLFERIRSALDDGRRIPIRWQCQEHTCRCGVHEGDLLKHTNDVKLEATIAGPSIRPDLCLYKQGAPYKLIEIVVTHAPETPTRDYAQQAGILLLEFSLSRASDIDSVIRGATLNPNVVNLEAKHCACQVCPHCKSWRACDNGHRYCRRCDSCGFGTHPYCERCQSCVTRSHRHCVSCGEAMTWTKGGNPMHYCCSVTDRFKLPRCSDRVNSHSNGAAHGHCRECGSRTGINIVSGQPYDRCRECKRLHRQEQIQAQEEWERQQQARREERQAKERQEKEQWRELNEWYQSRLQGQ